MRNLKRWGARAVGLYFVFLLLLFIFSVLSMKFPSLAMIERRVNPAKFVFWQNQKFYSNPPLFSSVMSDTKGQLSTEEPANGQDIDIWVLLLEGPEDIKNASIAQQLGLKIDQISQMQPGVSQTSASVALSFRLHPIPFFVERRSVVVMDALYLRTNYKAQCLDEMVYGEMISQRDQALWDRCKTT